MATRRRLAALILVLSVVLSGCAADSAAFQTTADENDTNTTTETTVATTTTEVNVTEKYSVPVEGDDLPVDADRTFARVQALVGTNVEPQSVTVREGTARSNTADYYTSRSFFRIMGLDETNYSTKGASGVTYRDGEVRLTTREASDAEVERVLAHEFIHTVQMRSGMTESLNRESAVSRSTDASLVRQALVEGGAVYVTDSYSERFQSPTVHQSDVVAEEYESGPAGNRYLWAPYHFGYRYVAATVDSPNELDTAYENHPETTEQLIHNYGPAEEPALDLELSTDDSGSWFRTDADTKGELVTRIVLRSQLSRARAAAAASGWGNDRLYVYEHSSGRTTGLAWALRWDDADEADEAQAAFRSYAAKHGDDSEASVQVERVTRETLVVFAGDDEFVDNAYAAGSDDEVEVAIDNRTTAGADVAFPAVPAPNDGGGTTTGVYSSP
ncbi:hypothetical protein [Halostella pelagica]|uniref:hypothetical protein n=1 Tax=Halostella pelagica TaxID=2583824 RepID=UPI00108195C7|nr:hypothetical protein [Halostella pelagica]